MVLVTSLCDLGYTIYQRIATEAGVAYFLFLSPSVLAMSMVSIVYIGTSLMRMGPEDRTIGFVNTDNSGLGRLIGMSSLVRFYWSGIWEQTSLVTEIMINNWSSILTSETSPKMAHTSLNNNGHLRTLIFRDQIKQVLLAEKGCCIERCVQNLEIRHFYLVRVSA